MRRSLLGVPATTRSAGGAFTPTDIAGLRGWWDASNSGSITASSGAVSQWDDLSGNGYHMTQPTGTNQPTTGTRTINSLNVIDFDGLDNFLYFSSTPSTIMGASAAGSVFYVMAIDADPPASGGGAVFQYWGTDSGTPNSHEPYEDGNIYTSWGSTARKTVGNPAGALTTPRQIDISTASGAWNYNIDGANLFTTGTNTVGWYSASTTEPGLGGGFTVPFWLDGRIAEIVIYNTVLAGADLTNIRNYLKAKWGTA